MRRVRFKSPVGSVSQCRRHDHFVLKGAMLMRTWFDIPFRPTRDLDLLGFGADNPDAMLATFRNICAVELDDGVEFEVGALTIDLIRDELEFGGLRLKTYASPAGPSLRSRFRRGDLAVTPAVPIRIPMGTPVAQADPAEARPGEVRYDEPRVAVDGVFDRALS